MDPFEWARAEYARLEPDAALAVEASFQAAEEALSPVLLSREGERLGIDPRDLWSMPRERAERLASEELREWWAIHGRPTKTALIRQMFSADLQVTP